MSEIQPFVFPATSERVRVVLVDGEPWFVAADACAVLGYRNGRAAVEQHVPDRHRNTVAIHDGSRGNPNFAVVSEAGLYRLVMRSNLPDAEQFQDWVTGEVLPAIRKTGSYGTPALPDITTPVGVLAMAEQFAETARQLVAAGQRIAELEPDASRARQTMDAAGLSLIGTVAKRFGIKERALREFLYSEKLIIRGGGRHNEPYARFIESKHFELKLCLVEIDPDRPPEQRSVTYVTPKGEALIWHRLRSAGYVNTPRPPTHRQPQLFDVQEVARARS